MNGKTPWQAGDRVRLLRDCDGVKAGSAGVVTLVNSRAVLADFGGVEIGFVGDDWLARDGDRDAALWGRLADAARKRDARSK